MPLGIVTPEDYNKDLYGEKHIPEQESSSRIEDKTSIDETSEIIIPTQVEVLEAIPKGRGNGHTGVPESIRMLIGESAIEEGRGAATAIGKFLGLSDSSVSAYTNSATSTATYKDRKPELEAFLSKARSRISKKAAGKLYKALDVIDDDKLAALDAVQASHVAKNMGAIIKQMEPDNKGNTNINGPVITFYAPHLVQETKFESITVSE